MSSRFHRVALAALALSAFGLPKSAIAATANSPASGSGSVVIVNQSRVIAAFPTQRSAPDYVVPTVPIKPSTSTGSVLPAPGQTPAQPSPSSNLPSIFVNPTPSVRPSVRPSLPPAVTNPVPMGGPATGLNYRVIVAAQTPIQQEQVKALVPGAFRTTINGQSVLQAGLFREPTKADEIYQLLIRNNLQASVLAIPAIEIPPTVPSVIPPASVPQGRAVVVIDPGHGGGDPGAVGIGGLQEKNAVFEISRQVAALLAQRGIQAILTRPGDQEVDLKPRVSFAKQANADLFVSIHANAISMSRPDINGLETYYYSASGEGRRLAQTIHSAILQDVGMRDRGVRTANFYVIRYTSMPSVLVEVGFVTGSEDAARLANSSGRTQLAQAIARGIEQYIQAR